VQRRIWVKAGVLMSVSMLTPVSPITPAGIVWAREGGRDGNAGLRDDQPPARGQPGKDVMWLPTPDELMFRLFDVAGLSAADLVYDLGAGDGRVAIAAARRHGARAIGIEYDARLAHHAQRNAERAGLADRVRIIQGDIFKEDFSGASVLTLYLLDELNQQLRPTILRMKPGTRVVSNSFAMGDWEPDRVIEVGQHTGYFWRVPAQVGGRWRVEWPQHGPSVVIDIKQRYQRLSGQVVADGSARPLFGLEIDGDQLSFRWVDESDALRAVRVTVRGNQFEGRIVPPYGMLDGPPPEYPVRGTRLSGP